METGKYYRGNSKKLELVDDSVWSSAIEKCRIHISIRLKGRTVAGAHTDSKLGMDPYDYYLTYAYESIILGTWQWKDDYSLSQQMIRIIESTISTEVDKAKTKKAATNKVISTDFSEYWPNTDFEETLPDMVQEILHNKKVSVIEDSIKGNEDFEMFWECVKDGMKSNEIAKFMEKTPKQVYKIQERLVKKIKESPYFEDL